MRLFEATWTDADAAEADVALLPTGSTEQHGPHAPLGTDTLTAEAVADEGASRFEDAHDEPLAVAPAVPVGVSEEHRAFSGTLWVSEDTFRSYVRETVASLAHHGIDRVVLVNGHGGNTGPLREVAARISRHDDAYAVPFTWFEHVGDHSGEMGHAGPLETALLRHANPNLVREDRVEAAREGASDRWGEWAGGVNLAHDTDRFTANGVVGDPDEGDADRGRVLLDLAADALVEVLAAIVDRDCPDD